MDWRAESALLGCDLERNVLDHCAPEGCSGFDLYRQLLGDCFSVGRTTSALASLSVTTIRNYYRSGDSPVFFSFKSAVDIASLSRLLGRPLVVYQYFDSCKRAVPALSRVYDSRICRSASSLGVNSSHASFDYAGDRSPDSPDPKFFMLDSCPETSRLRVWCLPGDVGFLDSRLLSELDSRYASSGLDGGDVGSCALAAACRALAVAPPPIARPWSVLELCWKTSEVSRLLGGLSFAVVAHQGSPPLAGRPRLGRIFAPCRQIFKRLSLVYDRTVHDSPPWPEMRGLLLGLQGRVYELDSAVLALLAGRSEGANSGRKLFSIELQRRLLPWGPDQDSNFQIGGQAPLPGAPPVPTPELLSPCKCRLCLLCPKYHANLENRGSQRRYSVSPDLFCLLRCFGLDSPENLSAVRSCLRCSVAGMDLETSTLELEPGSRDPAARLRLPFESLSDSVRSGHQAFAQKILLIGHLDDMLDDESPGEAVIFSTPEGPDGVKTVCHQYLAYVLERKAAMVERKKSLLAPLFDFVQAHFAAFTSYFTSRASESEESSVPRIDQPDLVLGAWKNSLLWHLQNRLERLAGKYQVYAFNASGFDLPLLAPHLLTYNNKDVPGTWRIQREGSEVTKLSAAGLSFRGE